MNYEKSDVASIVIFIIGLLVCGIFAYSMYSDGKGTIDIIPVVGSVASLFGFIVAIIQIIKTRSSSEAARRAAQDAKSRVHNYVSLSDIYNATRMLDDVKRYLRKENYQAAELRMSDLRGRLTKVKNHEILEELDREGEFKNIISDLGMEVTNLNKSMMDSSKTYDGSKPIGKLEEAKDIMQEMASRIKFGKNVSN